MRPTGASSGGVLDGRSGAALVLAAALVLYGLSAAPGVLWGDSAKLALMARNLDLRTNPGGHPGYVLLAGALVRAIPLDGARLLNLLSAVGGAASVTAVFLVARRLAGAGAGLVAACTLAVAHVPWLASSIAETYAPAMAGLAFGLYALLRWRGASGRPDPGGRPVAWAAVAGAALGFGASLNAVVAIAGLGLVPPLLPRLRGPAAWAAFLAAGLAGLAPYWAVALARGDAGALAGGVGFEMGAYFGGAGGVRELLRMPAYLAYQLPGPALVLVPVGALALWRRGDRDVPAALLAASFVVVAFSAAWLRQRQFLILDAAVVLLAVLAGVGAPRVAEWARARWARRRTLAALAGLSLLLPPLAYLLTPPVAGALGIDLVGARELPYRSSAAYYLRPWKGGYDGTVRFVADAAAVLGPGDLLFADFTVERPLLYGLEGSDVEVRETDRFVFGGDPAPFVEEIERALSAGRRVFLADDHAGYYFVPALRERFRLEEDGVLTRVLPGPVR